MSASGSRHSRARHPLLGRARHRELLRQPLAGVVDQGLAAGPAQGPQVGVGHATEVALDGIHGAAPAVGAAGFGPERVSLCGVPRGDVHPVGHVTHRNLRLGPAGEEAPEEPAAHLAVQAAHPVDRAAAPEGEVGHVERLVRVVRVLPAERQEILEPDAQVPLGVSAEVPVDEGRREAVEARGYRGVRGEEVAGTRDGQGHVEALAAVLYECPGALEHREGRVPLVEVAHLGVQAECPEQPPAADPQHELLPEAQLRTAAVQLAGDGADGRRVRRVIAVEQVEPEPPHLHLPGAEPDPVARQREREAEPLTARVSHRADRELPWIVVRVERLLAAVRRDGLAEVPLLVQEPNADHRDAEVAPRLELVAGHVAEAAGVDGEGLAEAELHAEVGDPGEGRLGVTALEPGRGGRVLAPDTQERLDPAPVLRAGQDLLERGPRDRLQHDPRVVREGPELRLELGPKLVGAVVPRPAQVQRELREGLGGDDRG